MYQCLCSFQAWIVSQVTMPTRNLSKVNTIFVTFFDTFLKFICEYKTLSDAIDDNLAWNQYQYPTLPYIHNARW